MDEIQSLSICCPSPNGCINHCKTCTALQYEHDYENKYDSPNKCKHLEYWSDVKKRMRYALSKGCTTLILTGSNEPQQNFKWLETLYTVMQSLPEQFMNIEIQTTGAFIDEDYLEFLKGIGVTTLALSTFSIFNDKRNRDIIQCADKNLNISKLCHNAYALGLNIRICVNVTDECFTDKFIKYMNSFYERYPEAKCPDIFPQSEFNKETINILNRCSFLKANQVTFRKMWTNNLISNEGKWIMEHCAHSNIFIESISTVVKEKGKLINILPYGAARYDYMGFSIVIDLDCMAKDTNNKNTRYYIIRENGKMYSSWDSKASLVF